MRRTPVTAAALALALGLTGLSAGAAAAADGSVTDTIVGTITPGLLTIAGTGVNVAASSKPGEFGSAVGATLLTVTDLTGGTAGWSVTAQYAAPADTTVVKDLGGANMLVSATGLTTDLTGLDLKAATDQPLSAPVTMATTGEAAGTGVTAFTAQYKVKLPATAKATETYGGSVTYTVATVR
jgi:hypothetical protein